MYKHIFFLLLLTLNVPLQIGKCTTRGTCTPVWEPLSHSLSAPGGSTNCVETCQFSQSKLLHADILPAYYGSSEQHNDKITGKNLFVVTKRSSYRFIQAYHALIVHCLIADLLRRRGGGSDRGFHFRGRRWSRFADLRR